MEAEQKIPQWIIQADKHNLPVGPHPSVLEQIVASKDTLGSTLATDQRIDQMLQKKQEKRRKKSQGTSTG